MSGLTNSSAQRQAKNAAKAADQQRYDLENQTAIDRKRQKQEKIKSQRILMRSLRAGSGGYFETDSADSKSIIGNSGVLG